MLDRPRPAPRALAVGHGALLVFATLAACDDGPSSITGPLDARVPGGQQPDRERPDMAPDPPPAPGPPRTVLRLALDAPDHATGDILGWSLGAGTTDVRSPDGAYPSGWTLATIAARMMGPGWWASGPPQPVRFSGVQIDGFQGADGYHFAALIDPIVPRTPGDPLAPRQYMALVDHLRGTPIVTLNFGTGTAAEAGAYARYLTGDDPADPLVAIRHRWGRIEPWRPAFFEIGSEPYGWWNTGASITSPFAYAHPERGDPAWRGRPSADPADFAARALTYVDSVREVVPDARFLVPLSDAAMHGWGDLRATIDALRPLLTHPAVSGVVVHHYQVDALALLGLDEVDSDGAIIAGTTFLAEGFAALFDALAALDRPTPLGVAVTEYHVAGSYGRDRFTRGDQAIVGLGIADMLIFFARIGVSSALQHVALNFDTFDAPDREPLLEPWYVPLRHIPTGSVREIRVHSMASLSVTRFIADRVLSDTVVPQAEVAAQAFGQIGGRVLAWPALSAVAFVDGPRAELVVLNRNLAHAETLALRLPEGWQIEAGHRWAPARPDQNPIHQPVSVGPLTIVGDVIALPAGSVAGIALRRR